MTKWMWIVAGPNGAGKSSFAGAFLVKIANKKLIKLNADERTLELRKQFPDAEQDDLNLQAAIHIDKRVEELIESGHSFVVETVLSSPKYRDDVLRAKELGFKIGIIYVSLHPPELSPQRVSERAKKGGHDVPYERAIKRHGESHKQLSWFAPLADILYVFDNSNPNNKPILVAARADGKRMQYFARGLNPSIDNALKELAPKTRQRKPEP